MGLLDGSNSSAMLSPQPSPGGGMLNGNLGQYTPRMVNGRLFLYDSAGNIAAYQDGSGTLVPGPSLTASTRLRYYTPQEYAAGYAQKAPQSQQTTPTYLDSLGTLRPGGGQ